MANCMGVLLTNIAFMLIWGRDLSIERSAGGRGEVLWRIFHINKLYI